MKSGKEKNGRDGKTWSYGKDGPPRGDPARQTHTSHSCHNLQPPPDSDVSDLQQDRELTERKQAKASTTEQQGLLEAIYRNAPLIMMVVDGERRVRQVNGFASQFADRSTEEMVGLRGGEALRCLHALDDPQGCGFGKFCERCTIRDTVLDTLANGTTNLQVEADYYPLPADGRTSAMKLLVSSTPLVFRDEHMALVTMLDITERELAQEELRRSNNLLERIFEVLPAGLWLTDREGTLLRGNPAGIRIWGAEPKVPISEYGVFKAWRLPERIPVEADDWALAKTIRERVTIVDELLEIEAFDGKRKTILNYTAPILAGDGTLDGAIVINLDVSDRLALEAQLRQAQKMESVGRLAGGVAHDFNNLLMGMMNYVELCRDEVGANHPIREWLDEITREAELSANLTRQLLAFARKQTIAPKVLDLNDAVEGMLKMLRRLIGEDIDLSWQPGANLGPVRVDPGQIDQILANLCVNARDAIDGCGKVTIETKNASITADCCADHAYFEPGDYVMLAVTDDGCGMNRETLENVFEPFFTTKPIGEGTGLGLATVYGIVKQNEGFVNAYSEPDKGTTFRIYLPRVEGEETARNPAGKSPEPEGGSETVLLVEDEASIRATTGMFLEKLGYAVLVAENPEKAMARIRDYDDPIDLMITDMVMPGMSGCDLASKLAPGHPDMKVLYMSGYPADAIAHRGILEDNVEFLSKPFTRDDLAKKLREMLD